MIEVTVESGVYTLRMDREDAHMLQSACGQIARQWEPLGDLKSKEMTRLLTVLARDLKRSIKGD
jgi:hypothetical protein